VSQLLRRRGSRPGADFLFGPFYPSAAHRAIFRLDAHGEDKLHARKLLGTTWMQQRPERAYLPLGMILRHHLPRQTFAANKPLWDPAP